MAGPVEIPPWLNIDPTAPVGRLLEGYRSGLAAAEAQNQAAARAQQQQLAAEQAAQLNAYRQEQQQALVQHWEQQLRLQQEKDQRAAAEAAIQSQAMNELQKRTAAGEPFEKVWPELAPRVLYRHPQSIAQSIRAVTPPGEPQVGVTPSGKEYLINPRTGAAVFSPLGAQPQTVEGIAKELRDEQGNPLGTKYVPGARGGVHFLPRTELSPEGRVRALSARLAVIKGLMEDATPAELPTLKGQRDEIMSELKKMTTAPAPATGFAPLPEATPAEAEAAAASTEEE